jgi:hypothetical protein
MAAPVARSNLREIRAVKAKPKRQIRFLSGREAMVQLLDPDFRDRDDLITVVTDDRWLREPGGKLAYGDRRFLQDILAEAERDPTAKGDSLTMKSLKATELREFADAGAKTATDFGKLAEALMSAELATKIRRWRVDEHGTWRWIAQEMYDGIPTAGWNPPSNQLMGMAFCDVAARFLHEDAMKEPWN